MKRLLLLFFTFLAGYCAYSQDIITTREGEEIRARVAGTTDVEVTYFLFDEVDGPVYSVLKSRLIMIRYKDGSIETFSKDSGDVFKGMGSNPATEEPAREIPKEFPKGMLKPQPIPTVKTPDPSLRYAKYKGMKRAGIIMSILGTAAMVGGSEAIGNWGTRPGYTNSTGQLLLGTFTLASGLVSVCVGVPLWISGSVSQKRYRQSTERVVFIGPSPSSKGLALTYRF